MKREKYANIKQGVYLNERNISILVHSLFSAWMLSFIFEGQLFNSLASKHGLAPGKTALVGSLGIFCGLLFSCLFIKTKKSAKRLFLFSYSFFVVTSLVFLLKNPIIMIVFFVLAAVLSGSCVASWAFYLKSSAPRNKRIKTVADMLILSNVFMILINIVAINFSSLMGLSLSVLMLLCAFLLALKLPEDDPIAEDDKHSPRADKYPGPGILQIFIFLYLFIAIMTMNSGIMYRIVNPAFAHLQWLASWYWAIPYIVALIIVRSLPGHINKTYILYAGIGMIGLSFIGFVGLGRGIPSYFVVNTLMMGACGVYDLFWWSILAEMLELDRNPCRVLGIGLSANILGIMLGSLFSIHIMYTDNPGLNPTLLALTIVCISLVLLPLLHKHLSALLKGHVYLVPISHLPTRKEIDQLETLSKFAKLTAREHEVTELLLQGKTYKNIGNELVISENTVKYYIKNIYSKIGVNSRDELIDLLHKVKTDS